jgi:hypothetical protein
VLLAVAVGACSHNPQPAPQPGTPAANLVVAVENQNVNDVDVFANVNGVPQRLGTVTSQQTGDFEVNWDQVGPSGHFSVIVSPIGSGAVYRSGSLPLGPGSTIAVQVAPVLRNSSTQVY